MEKIISFLENQIVVVWISPLVLAAIIGIWNMILHHIKNTKVGIPYRIRNKKPVYIFNKYCEKNRIQPIISYGDSNALQVTTELDKGNVQIKANMDLSHLPKANHERNFVMILLKYIPLANFSYFYKKGYSFIFDIKSKKGICGIQLEIKNTHGGKIIDEYIQVSPNLSHHSFKLNEYSNSEGWKDINEICFTIFTEDGYILERKGSLEIYNCMLKIEQ